MACCQVTIFLRIAGAYQARANKPLDPEPVIQERPKVIAVSIACGVLNRMTRVVISHWLPLTYPMLSLQHAVKIERFANKKPTVLDQYNKRVRQAQAGGGAKSRAYELRQDELDEVKNLRTQLRAMEVNEKLSEQVQQRVCWHIRATTSSQIAQTKTCLRSYGLHCALANGRNVWKTQKNRKTRGSMSKPNSYGRKIYRCVNMVHFTNKLVGRFGGKQMTTTKLRTTINIP